MTDDIYRVIIKARIDALITISKPDSPPVSQNNPPVWDEQPNPVFIQGTASNYSLADRVSDPDMDSVDVSLVGSPSLPTGVIYNTTLDRFEYDGAGPVASATSITARADDGTDTTDSIPFNVIVKDAVQSIPFPRIMRPHLGGRTESDAWRLQQFREQLAFSHEVVFNFADNDVSHVAETIAAVKALNQSVLTGQYNDMTAFLLSSPTQVARKQFVIDNWVTPAQPGGTAADGMSREPDGTIVSGWPNKDDVNPTNFPNEFNGELPMVWHMDELYDRFYTGSLATTFDFIFIDIWRMYPRFEDGVADWNRDGVALKDRGVGRYGNFDATDEQNAAMIAAKEAVHASLQTKAMSDRGTGIEISGECNWCDYFDGAQAQNDVILPADVPSEMVAITGGAEITNWSKLCGFNPDGTTRPGSFERGYKSLQRMVDVLDTSSLTNTVRMGAQIELTGTQYDLAAYLMGIIHLAGGYVAYFTRSSWRTPGDLDEYIGEDLAGLTISQKISKMGWMGYPIGGSVPFGQLYSANVQGGIIVNGMYALHYTDDGLATGADTGFLIVNPHGNGSQSFDTSTLPFASKFINGGQRAVNDGSNLSGTIIIPEKTAYFLLPQ